MSSIQPLRRCSTCKSWKPLECFFGRKRQPTKCCTRCIVLARRRVVEDPNRADYNRRYYEANRDKELKKARVRGAAWRRENPDRARARRLLYYQANRERLLEKSRRGRRLHPEKTRAASQRWRERSPERYSENQRRARRRRYERYRDRLCADACKRARKYEKLFPERGRRRSAMRRALKRDSEIGDIPRDADHQLLGFQGGRCAYCHEPLTEYHVDHVVPLSRGGPHTWENLVLACPTCNMSKNDRTPDEWSPWRMRRMRGTGRSLRQIAGVLGTSEASARRALAREATR